MPGQARSTIITASPNMTTASLDEPMFSDGPISTAVKGMLVGRMWPSSAAQPVQDIVELETYFTYFQHETQSAWIQYHSIHTFEDFILIIDTIRGNPTSNLADLRIAIANVKPSLASDQTKLSASIELVIRLWLLINVTIRSTPSRNPTEGSLPWLDTQSLTEVLERHMTVPAASSVSTTETFSDYLNVVEMKRIANFQVVWTSDLSGHLTLRDGTVHIFYQVVALRRLSTSLLGSFLPSEFINETLSTLSLLVPQTKQECNSWLRAQVDVYRLDPFIIFDRQVVERGKRSYPHWQMRLVALSEAFDRKMPTGPIQWWYDRRDMGRWWNYWLVMLGILLTVLFGLIQSVTGILQVIGVGGGGD
ncbi:hypothetical protein QBC34DRAFT_332668 [Podospora aff. communis PSN243]|uniref:Uncharacterized protein n=1 Tax=Podospora aff. communis PSN243 TaxID=3040156 RepID=A0AAV9GEI3_9PEZI|nr:hypothetical protein QBC34DRAFT_332668 [Podospora aff. communis PSN243]